MLHHLQGTLLTLLFLLSSAWPSFAASFNCKNPSAIVYNKSPSVMAPEKTRGVGILIMADRGPGMRIPDTRPECLPLAVRYNNPGAQKSKSAPGQIGRDYRKHAVFQTVPDGIGEIIAWLERRRIEKVDTAFKLISRYAPPTDCIGSPKKLPNGKCPKGFPLNPTAEYAKEIASALGIKDIHVRLGIGKTKCKAERSGVRKFAERILTIEAGRAFCSKSCKFTDKAFNAAINKIWGPIPGNC